MHIVYNIEPLENENRKSPLAKRRVSAECPPPYCKINNAKKGRIFFAILIECFVFCSQNFVVLLRNI